MSEHDRPFVRVLLQYTIEPGGLHLHPDAATLVAVEAGHSRRGYQRADVVAVGVHGHEPHTLVVGEVDRVLHHGCHVGAVAVFELACVRWLRSVRVVLEAVTEDRRERVAADLVVAHRGEHLRAAALAVRIDRVEPVAPLRLVRRCVDQVTRKQAEPGIRHCCMRGLEGRRPDRVDAFLRVAEVEEVERLDLCFCRREPEPFARVRTRGHPVLVGGIRLQVFHPGRVATGWIAVDRALGHLNRRDRARVSAHFAQLDRAGQRKRAARAPGDVLGGRRVLGRTQDDSFRLSLRRVRVDELLLRRGDVENVHHTAVVGLRKDHRVDGLGDVECGGSCSEDLEVAGAGGAVGVVPSADDNELGVAVAAAGPVVERQRHLLGAAVGVLDNRRARGGSVRREAEKRDAAGVLVRQVDALSVRDPVVGLTGLRVRPGELDVGAGVHDRRTGARTGCGESLTGERPVAEIHRARVAGAVRRRADVVAGVDAFTVRRRDVGSAGAPRAGRGRHGEVESAALAAEVLAEPRCRLCDAVDLESCRVSRAVGHARGVDLVDAIRAEARQCHPVEHRGGHEQVGRAVDHRRDADGGEDVPRAQRAFVVVARQARRGGVIQLGDGPVQHVGRLVRRLEPVVDPRSRERGLVGEVVAGLRVGTRVEALHKRVKCARGRGRAASALDELADVVRNHPAVLVAGRLVELGAVGGLVTIAQVEPSVEAGALSWPNVLRLGVEDVLPVLRTCHKGLVRLVVAESLGELRDREVVNGVFEHPGSRVVALAVLDEADSGVLDRLGPSGVLRGEQLRAQHGFEGGLAIVVGCPECVERREDHLVVVARHARRTRRPLARLLGQCHDRAVDVVGDIGKEHCDQLGLAAVHVPALAREVDTAEEVAVGVYLVHLIVVAQILAVDVLADGGLKQRMVERGVELDPFVVGAPGDVDCSECLLPRRLRGGAHLVERHAGGLGGAVCCRGLDAGVAEARLGRYLRVVGEGQPAAYIAAVVDVGVDATLLDGRGARV